MRVSGSVDGEILRVSGSIDGEMLRVSGSLDGETLRAAGSVDGFRVAGSADGSKESVHTGRCPLIGCPAEQSGASSGIGGFASASALSTAACAEAFDSISPLTSRLRAVCLRRRRRR